MAKSKTVKFNGNKPISINPKSKSLTYEYTGNTAYTFQIDNNFISGGKVINGYKSQFQNIATKSGNNLVITSLFTTASGKAKKVTTTIKNFFSNPSADYKVTFDSYRYMYENGDNVSSYTITPNTSAGSNGLYTAVKYDTTYSDFTLGTKKNDTINISSGGGDFVYDTKGNDTYNNNSGDEAYIYDLSGKETYNISGQSAIFVYDYNGNDKYFVDNDGSYLMAQDYIGNDTYKINSLYGESSSDFWIDDYKGKDKYYVTSNSGFTHNITDYKSDDKYYLTNATAEVNDLGGKDYYEIKNNTSDSVLSIIDSSKSNDTYKVSNSKDLTYGDLSVYDSAGNDKHIWTDVTFAELAPEDTYAIEDAKGNDKYTLRNVENIRISDNGGKDKYDLKGIYDKPAGTVTAVKNFQITDNGKKNDKYDLQFVGCEYAEDDKTSRSIIDDGGNDKYILASTANVRINDKAGNDTYTLKAPTDKKGNKIIFEGEEMFSVFNAKTEIYDDKGNDNYNISYAMGTKIYDSEGKDTYNIKGGTISMTQKFTEEITLDTTTPTVVMLEIHDTSTTSADTYNISNIVGQPFYAMGTPVFMDDGGNNKFNIKNAGKYINQKDFEELQSVENLNISNFSDLLTNPDALKMLSLLFSMPSFGIRCTGIGNDKYNISNSFLMANISDYKGDDKYNLKNISGAILIADNEGNDTYTISKNKASFNITDNSGNDTYTLDNLNKSKFGTHNGSTSVIISDKAGKDTLKISSLNKSSIVYMTNFSKSASEHYINNIDFGMIIYDKKNGGYVNLIDFYETTETVISAEEKEVHITGLNNSIETLKAGKKSINLVIDAGDYSKMEILREQVGAWLTAGGRNYEDVQDVLTGSSKDDINALVQIFQTGNVS